MRIPYAIQGMLFAPAIVGVTFFLKVLCPAAPGSGCLSDFLAPPIFLPAVFLESVLGRSIGSYSYEIVVILLYWALIGLLVGFICDLYRSRSRY